MSYIQPEEPRFTCPKCHREYSLNDQGVQYGLYSGGKLVRCNKCFENMKHEFWLRTLAEDNE